LENLCLLGEVNGKRWQKSSPTHLWFEEQQWPISLSHSDRRCGSLNPSNLGKKYSGGRRIKYRLGHFTHWECELHTLNLHLKLSLWAGGVALVEPSMLEVLRSIPSTTNKQTKTKTSKKPGIV
jgi:hypothetical protein